MKLYYTSSVEGVNQIKPHLSIGGYKSNSIVANGEFGGFFSDVSMMAVKDNLKQYLCLILENDSDKKAYDFCVHFIYPESNFLNIKIAGVIPNQGYVEPVMNQNQKPTYVDFVEANGFINKVNLGDIEANSQLAIWLEKSLNINTIYSSEDSFYRQLPTDQYRYEEVPLETVEQIKMVLSWDWERQLVERIPEIQSAVLTSNYIDVTFNYKMIDPSLFVSDFGVRVNGVLKPVDGVAIQNSPTNTIYRLSMGENFTSTDVVYLSIKNGNISEDLPVEEGYKYRNLLLEVLDYEVTNGVISTVTPALKLLSTSDFFRITDKITDKIIIVSDKKNCGTSPVTYRFVFTNYLLLPRRVYFDVNLFGVFSVGFGMYAGDSDVRIAISDQQFDEVILQGYELKDEDDGSVVQLIDEYQYITWIDPYSNQNELEIFAVCDSNLPNASPIHVQSNTLYFVFDGYFENPT